MRQLGVLCAAGEVLTAVAILLLVPEIGALLERGRRRASSACRSSPRSRGRAPARARWPLGARRCGDCDGARARAPTLDHGVVALDAKVLPAAGVYDEIYATFGGTRGQLLVVSADRDEARARARADAVAEAAEKLAAAAPSRASTRSARSRLRSPRSEARLQMRDASISPENAQLLTKRCSPRRASRPTPFEPALEAFAHPGEGVSDVRRGGRAGAAWVKRRHLGKDERGTLAVTFVRLAKGPSEGGGGARVRSAPPIRRRCSRASRISRCR